MLIFNFHHVDPIPLHADRKHISITPEGLARFIRTMRFLGFEFVSVKDVLKQGINAFSSSRHVLITLDDGYVNNYRYAVPVFEAEACPAVIFVLAGKFAGSNDWDQGNLPEEERDQLMSLEQIRDVAQSRWVAVASHGMLHRKFPTLSAEDLATEINASYRILSDTLGNGFTPVMAYPWGEYNATVVEAMRQSPYQLAMTTDKGPWQPTHDPFQIPRYSAYYRDGNPWILFFKLLRNGILPPILFKGLFGTRFDKKRMTTAS